jgi:hypothetical protein
MRYFSSKKLLQFLFKGVGVAKIKRPKPKDVKVRKVTDKISGHLF